MTAIDGPAPNRSVGRLRAAAFIEATTLLVMLLALLARVTFGEPDIGPVIGPLHGLAFLTYVVMVIFASSERAGASGERSR